MPFITGNNPRSFSILPQSNAAGDLHITGRSAPEKTPVAGSLADKKTAAADREKFPPLSPEINKKIADMKPATAEASSDHVKALNEKISALEKRVADLTSQAPARSAVETAPDDTPSPAATPGRRTTMSSAIKNAFSHINFRKVLSSVAMIAGSAVALTFGLQAAGDMMDMAKQLFGDTGGDVAHMLLMGGVAYGAAKGVQMAAGQFGKNRSHPT